MLAFVDQRRVEMPSTLMSVCDHGHEILFVVRFNAHIEGVWLQAIDCEPDPELVVTVFQIAGYCIMKSKQTHRNSLWFLTWFGIETELGAKTKADLGWGCIAN